MIGHENDDGDEQDNRDREPGELGVDIWGWDRSVIALGPERGRHIDPVDHDEAEDGEQCRDGQQDRVGVRRAPAQRHVHAERQDDDCADRDPQSLVHSLSGRPRHLNGPEGADEPGADEEAQFDVSPVGLANALHRLPGGRAHGATPGHPEGASGPAQAVARSLSSETMRWASPSSEAGIPLLTNS